MSLDWGAELLRGGVTAFTALVASFFGAKWAETRKLQARFEKLDQIREEMREVTRVQEEIKRQLQGGEWNRQTLWKQRLDSYTQLLRVSTDYLDRCALAKSVLLSKSPDLKFDARELSQFRSETFKTLAVVEIFCDAEILACLKRFFAHVQRHASADDQSLKVNDLSAEIEALMELQADFVSAARKQLKVTIDSE